MNKQEPEGGGAGAFTAGLLLKKTGQVKIFSFFVCFSPLRLGIKTGMG